MQAENIISNKELKLIKNNASLSDISDSWVDNLNQNVNAICDHYGLKPIKKFSTGMLSACIFCIKTKSTPKELTQISDHSFVLKIAGHKDYMEREIVAYDTFKMGFPPAMPIHALNHIKGVTDDISQVLIMKYIEPGNIPNFTNMPTNTTVRLILEVSNKIHKYRPQPEFMSLTQGLWEHRAKWLPRRFKTDPYLVETIFNMFLTRFANYGDTIALHGDFQNKNLCLNQDNKIIAIDPLPMNGPKIMDLVFWSVTSKLEIKPVLFEFSKQTDIAYDDLLDWAFFLSIFALTPRLPERSMPCLNFIKDYQLTRPPLVPNHIINQLLNDYHKG